MGQEFHYSNHNTCLNHFLNETNKNMQKDLTEKESIHFLQVCLKNKGRAKMTKLLNLVYKLQSAAVYPVLTED